MITRFIKQEMHKLVNGATSMTTEEHIRQHKKLHKAYDNTNRIHTCAEANSARRAHRIHIYLETTYARVITEQRLC